MAPQTPGRKKSPPGSDKILRDQAVAPLNLPPLAEFENFLRSRFRGTRDPASTFFELQTEWRVEPQLEPQLDVLGLGASYTGISGKR